MLLLLKSLHVFVEPVEVLVPVLLEADDPLVHGLEAARVEAVEPLLPSRPDPAESHFAKHAQVLRRARLRDPQCACKLIDRTLSSFQKDEDPPPLRLGNGVERIRGRGGSCHAAQNICPYRHMSNGRGSASPEKTTRPPMSAASFGHMRALSCAKPPPRPAARTSARRCRLPRAGSCCPRCRCMPRTIPG